MASKIKFKLYRIDTPLAHMFQQATEATATPQIGEWQYIVGKNENDILTSKGAEGSNIIGTIDLNSQNFLKDISPTELINPLPVFEEKDDDLNITRLLVYVGGDTLYIRRTQVEGIFTDPVPKIFDFYVNPQRISFNKQKLITEVRTRGGWDIQHWGEQLTEITVEGITGGLHKDDTRSSSPGGIGQTLLPGEDISKSSAWKSLRILRNIYDADHSKTRSSQLYKLGFSIFEDFYIGYFQSFNGPEIVADRPYIMTYSFVFKVEEKISDTPLRFEYERSLANG